MKYKEIIVFYQDVEPECIKELSKNYISTTDPVLKIALRMIQSGYFGKNYKFSDKAGVEELLEATPVIYFDNSMTPLIVTQLQEMVTEANSANESIALDEGVGCLMSGTYSIEGCFQKPHTRLMLSLPHTKSLFCEQKIQVGLRATDINLADNDKPKNTACSL
ncbi:hypothetical protein [Vibrio harveyi]|uniref:hypothetical protein n=1 Tax=Vibrio harveyi TaxID=669 RepID=UPI003CEE6E5E